MSEVVVVPHSHPSSSRASRENRSVRKAAALLRAAAADRSGASVSALARAAELPRATALRMIESLVAERLLARLPDDRIVIGAGLIQLARTADLTEVIVHASSGLLERLRAEVGETVTLTVVLPDGTPALVRQLDGPHLLGLTSWVGRPLPLHATSSGKIVLANARPEQFRAMLRSPLARLGSRTITDPQALEREVETVRGAGWSQIEDELEEGVASISVGILVGGSLVGCVNISGPTTRFTQAVRAAALPALLDVRTAIEATLQSVEEVTPRS